MNDYPIKVGSMLFTMVDPEPGYEVEYNRWYERDHFYAGCMVGPHLFAGKRWVATKELKDLRFPRGDTSMASPVDKGSYLAIYWVLEGKHDEHFAWAGDQVVWLYTNERGFPNRTHAHTVLLKEPSAVYRDDDPVPIELALDHPYKGLAVLTVDPADGVAIRAAVAALPERQRATIVARFYLGLSVAETAEHLGCAEGTVKAATSQALDRLRSHGFVDSHVVDGRPGA